MFGSYNKLPSSSSSCNNDGDAAVETFSLVSSSSYFEYEYYG